MELANQLSDYFAKQPTSFFRHKTDFAIKKNVINKNVALKVNLYSKGDDDWLLTSRVLRVASYNVYYAHREKRIRDACLRTLALQLIHLPQQKLIAFLTTENISSDLIDLIREKLVDHLIPIFNEWKIKFVFTYWYVENMLRAVRNSICEKLPSDKFIEAATYICQDQQKLSISVIKSFTTAAITQANCEDLKNALAKNFHKLYLHPNVIKFSFIEYGMML